VGTNFWTRTILLFVISTLPLVAADKGELQQRRQRAAATFHDGILLVHARSALDSTGDGFRQDPVFYYFTGLENTPSALLAIDGRSGQSWLFLSLPARSALLAESMDPLSVKSLEPEISPGPEDEKHFGIEHVEDWSELQKFLANEVSSSPTLYYVPQRFSLEEVPANVAAGRTPEAPLWATEIAKQRPSFQLKGVGGRVYTLMAVQSESEIAALRAAAKATVPAVMAGMRAIRPGISQRAVEASIESTCWQQGAHGVSFWPWVMAGDNGVFPHPWRSLTRYDHLNTVMQAGDLVRLDVGCEWEHYQGDLGRTVPVSGRFSDEQRETWNVFVAAYRAGVQSLREGTTTDEVFDAWRSELIRHRDSAKTTMAKQAIDAWSKRENVPFWGPHTINLDAGFIDGPLRAGMTIAFEPIASIGGQGFYLEDMFLITKNGAELLTPGVPYSADEIETAMR
jgi:Xaa-Pro aminopeptidase